MNESAFFILSSCHITLIMEVDENYGEGGYNYASKNRKS